MAKILVTGGAGFIGGHLVDKLIEKGHKVVVIDNLSTGRKDYNPPTTSSHSLREWVPNLNPKAKFYKIDIQSPKISQIFKKEKPEIVFHFAAQIDVRKSVENPLEDAKINILGALNLLENCRKYKVKKFIFASSGGAMYGDTEEIPTPESHPERPESPYGIQKLVVEKYLQFYKKTYGLDYVSLRYANIYGPRQNSKGEAGVVAIFTDKLLNNETPTIYGSGEQTRDYLYVDDAIEAAILALENHSGEIPIYNVGTGVEISVNDLYKLLVKEMGRDIVPKYGPPKKGEQLRSCLDYSKIKKELGWQPKISLEQGLKKTKTWFSN